MIVVTLIVLLDNSQKQRELAGENTVKVSVSSEYSQSLANQQPTPWTTIIGVLAAVIACTWAILAFSL